MLCGQEALLCLGGSALRGRATHTWSLMQPGEEEPGNLCLRPVPHLGTAQKEAQYTNNSQNLPQERRVMEVSFLTCQQIVAVPKPKAKGGSTLVENRL